LWISLSSVRVPSNSPRDLTLELSESRKRFSQARIKAFSESDFTEDLKKIDVPTLILHGDDDQIVPIQDSATLSLKIVKEAISRVVPGAPLGFCSTLKDHINTELITLIGLRQLFDEDVG
jgi:pimeloyl-ACP methyl ester carboxylesterase